MHEYSIVQALVDRVSREAQAQRAIKVHGLRVSLGELSGVDPQLLQTAYDTFRAGTVCAEANLELTQVTALWRCRGCGRTFVQGEPLQCARCGSVARLVQGDEILLEKIDLEVA